MPKFYSWQNSHKQGCPYILTGGRIGWMTDKNRINLRILAIASNMHIKSVFCARKNFQVIFFSSLNFRWFVINNAVPISHFTYEQVNQHSKFHCDYVPAPSCSNTYTCRFAFQQCIHIVFIWQSHWNYPNFWPWPT